MAFKIEFSKFDTHILLPKQQLCNYVKKKLAWFQQQNCTKIDTKKVTWQITLQITLQITYFFNLQFTLRLKKIN